MYVIRLKDGRYWTGSGWTDDESAAKRYSTEEAASSAQVPGTFNSFPYVSEL